jgi:hypothetical protein
MHSMNRTQTTWLQTEEQAGVSADEQKRERANKLVKRGVTERRKLEVCVIHCHHINTRVELPLSPGYLR